MASSLIRFGNILLFGLLAQQLFAGSLLDPNAYSSLGLFNPVGNLTISTDGNTPTIKNSSNLTLFTGVNSGGTAIFDFSMIYLAPGLTVTVTGTSPLALLTPGNANISGTINVIAGNIGGPGAGGTDPGGIGTGGGFGGAGGSGILGTGGGASYGNLLNLLQGGSSGGNGGGAGGNGGGALGIVSLNTLNVSGSIFANGNAGSNNFYSGGGGGSGGGILLNAAALSISGTLQANGATGGSVFAGGGAGGGGGGGRIALQTPSLIAAPATFSVTGGGNGKAGNIAYTGVVVPAGETFQLVNGLSSDVSGIISVQSGNAGGGVLNTVGGYTNTAAIDLGGPSSHIQGDALINAGEIRGTGYVDATLTNATGGTINLMSVDRMVLGGAGDSNSGSITVGGGDLQLNQSFANNQGGTINATDATLFLNEGMSNAGTLNLLSGTSNIFGSIDNLARGAITVTGGGTATFWGDVNNDGSIQVSSNGSLVSTAIFFGTLSGNNGITGTGRVFLNGFLNPGDDPAAVNFGGDLMFTSSSQYDAVLGGTAQGSYDMVSVAGELGLDGTLDLSLFKGFDPKAGDRFDILNWGSMSGTFRNVELPTLDPGLHWDLSSLYTNGQVGVQGQTPEPGTFLLLVPALCGLCIFRRIR